MKTTSLEISSISMVNQVELRNLRYWEVYCFRLDNLSSLGIRYSKNIPGMVSILQRIQKLHHD